METRRKRNRKWYYFIPFLTLLTIEIMIATYIDDNFIRPYLGDFLVVIMIYCFVMSVSPISIKKGLVVVLLFAFGIEFLQLIPLRQYFAQGESWIWVVLGSSFSFVDLLMYVLGIACCGILEFLGNK